MKTKVNLQFFNWYSDTKTGSLEKERKYTLYKKCQFTKVHIYKTSKPIQRHAPKLEEPAFEKGVLCIL